MIIYALHVTSRRSFYERASVSSLEILSLLASFRSFLATTPERERVLSARKRESSMGCLPISLFFFFPLHLRCPTNRFCINLYNFADDTLRACACRAAGRKTRPPIVDPPIAI